RAGDGHDAGVGKLAGVGRGLADGVDVELQQWPRAQADARQGLRGIGLLEVHFDGCKVDGKDGALERVGDGGDLRGVGIAVEVAGVTASDTGGLSVPPPPPPPPLPPLLPSPPWRWRGPHPARRSAARAHTTTFRMALSRAGDFVSVSNKLQEPAAVKQIVKRA